MNSKNQKTEEQWLPCEEGAIGGAAASSQNRVNQRSRREFLRAASMASVVVVGAGFAGWSLFGQGEDKLRALRNNPNYPGGIACSEVQRLLPEYISNSISEAALNKSITVHLTKCKHCCDIHDSMVAGEDVA